jgi:hypothetical protein
LSCSIGERQKDKKQKAAYFQNANDYAKQGLSAKCLRMRMHVTRWRLVAGKMTEVEEDNKKTIEQVKNIKIYADKALAIDANHAKANYVLG